MTARPPVSVLRPRLPRASAIAPYLEAIDEARWYSNMGPLVRRLEERLAEHFSVAADRIVTSANGTLALVQTLRSLNVRPGGLCVMPSWTFVATPAAAEAAGLVPYFVDVDAESWAMTPESVETLIAAGRDIAAAIPVSPFGAPLDLSAWEAFQARTGTPVIIDAAASFDTFAHLPTTLPVMVSLHATKVLGAGEGALMIAADGDLARRIRMAGNFGFHGTREAQVPGFNAKLSEYTAAVGLASLDQWQETRAGWQGLTDAFLEHVQRLPGVRPGPGFGDGWISSYGLIELPDPRADAVCDALAVNGVETRRWWGRGCHAQSAYLDCPRTPLPVTEALAARVIGLPFWLGLAPADMDYAFSAVAAALARDAA